MVDLDAKPPPAPRLAFFELLRAVSAQVIVLHHLALYGPLSDVAHPLAPVLLDFVARHGRLAVQVFFVLGGFLNARSLAKIPEFGLGDLRSFVVRRYRRIGLPYLVTLLLAVAANGLAARWMTHRSISPPPSLAEFVAHALYLQDILGVTAITAGIWYLAIDFQLVLLIGVLAAASTWIARALRPRLRLPALGVLQVVSGVLAVASLFWFNRDPDLDVWAIYFFGSYFLGLVLQWTLEGKLTRLAFGGYALLVCLAVAIDWRLRPVVALVTALAILGVAGIRVAERWPRSRVVAYLGRTSFSLFLVHFPVCLVVSAWLSRRELSAVQALAGMVVAFLLSHVAAWAFHRWVERPLRPRPLSLSLDERSSRT